MSRSTLRQWLQLNRPVRGRRPARRLFRPPFVEELEPRWVPNTVNWGVSGGGDWDTATNWFDQTTMASHVPGPTDDAVIGTLATGSLITHNTSAADSVHSVTASTSSTSFSLTGGSLSIASSGQFNGAFTLTGATSVTLSGAGTVTMAGGLTWDGPTMSGSGLTIVQGTFSLANATLDTRSLSTSGTVTDKGGTFLALANNAAVTNTGTWNVQGDSGVTGTGVFTNNGTVNGAAGAAGASFNSTFNNNGAVNVQNNTLSFDGGGTGTGTFTVSSGATLQFDTANYNLQSGSSVTGAGNILLGTSGSPTVTVSGGFTPTGSVSVLGVDFLRNPTLNFTSAVNGTGSATVTTLTLQNGTLTGSASVTVTSALTWGSSGTMSGTGLTNLQGSATVSSSPLTLDTRTFDNFGTVSDSATLTLSNNAVINNEGSASWTLSGPGTGFGGAGTFNNLGSFISAGSGVHAVGVAFNNSGTVGVTAATLSLEGGGTDTGSFNVGTGTTLQFNGGTHNLNAGSAVTGAGGVTFNAGTTNVNGAFTPTGPVAIQGTGTANFSGTVNGTGSASFTSLTLSANGTLTGAASVTVAGATAWSGGTMSGTGVTNLRGNSTLTGSVALTTRTLNNFAALSDSGALTTTSPAVVNNVGGATWTLQGNASVGGSGTFNNLGTLTDSSTTTITLSLPFNNGGVVNVQSGALRILGDGTDSGTFNVAAGTTLTFSAGSDTFTNGAAVNGAGTFVVSGNETMTVVGNVSVGSASFTFDGGTITGPGTLNVSSATTWNNGDMSGAGVTNWRGATAVTGTASNLNTRTVNNFGTLTQAQPANNVFNFFLFGATINNQPGAVWSVQTDVSLGVTGVFNNAGTLTLAPGIGGSFTPGISFNNSGAVNLQSGRADLIGTGLSTGSYSVAAGATLNFGITYNNPGGPVGVGSHTLAAASSVSGAGNVNFSGSATTVAGGFTPTGPILVTGDVTFTGTVNGTGAVTFASLSFTRGTLTGPASITVTGATAWTGGTMSGTGVSNLMGGLALSGVETLDTRTLNNFAMATHTGALALVNGGVINNRSGAAWNLQGVANLFGPGVYNNLGTLQSTGTDSFGVALNNSGSVNVQSGTISGNGAVRNAGAVTLGSGTTWQFASFTQTAGTLVGNGTLIGNVVINSGLVSPGFSPGAITVQGNYSQNGGTLNIEVTGTAPGTQFDTLTVTGTATLGGALNVLRPGGFVPAVGASFRFLSARSVSGTFASVSGLGINGSESFTVSYATTGVTLTVVGPPAPKIPFKMGVFQAGPGGSGVFKLDANGDGVIDAADPTFTFGVATDLPLVGDWSGLGFESVGVARATPDGLAQFILDSDGNNAFDTGDQTFTFGFSNDAVVLGDWNGDGRTKVGVARGLPDGSAVFSLDVKGDGNWGAGDRVVHFGLATDRFGAGNWTGTAVSTVIVERAGPGGVALFSEDTKGDGVFGPGDKVFSFGYNSDQFIEGDWNGDGRTKIGVVRPGPNGTLVFSLDTNGDGVFDAGDQVFTLPGSAADQFLIGKWKAPAGLSTEGEAGGAAGPALALDATFRANVDLAVALWAQAGLDAASLARLRGLTYVVAPLDGTEVAQTVGSQVALDPTAAGRGWSEGPDPQPGRIDLVTALAHEMGHALGLGEGTTADPNDVMFETLPPGVRRAPTAADVSAVFASQGSARTP